MRKESILLNGRKTEVVRWEVSKKLAKLVIVHGLGEHITRYDVIARDFTSQGIEMVGFDQRGHGKNPGIKGHVESFELFLKDLEEFINGEVENTVPLFMLGHSLGGLIAARYAEEYPSSIRGLVLSSGAFTYENVSPFLRTLVNLLSPILPRIHFSNGIKPTTLSRNEKIVEEYVNDPLVHNKITPRLAHEMFKNVDLLFERVKNLRMPVLLLAGERDSVVPSSATQKLFKLLTSKDKELEIFPGAYHEIFCDPEHKIAFRTRIIKWILEHASVSQMEG